MKPWEKIFDESFFRFLGGSCHQKSVMEIAQNYRKNDFLRITGEPVITGKNEKFSALHIWSTFIWKETFVNTMSSSPETDTA
jgi:hypothetical protein